MEGGEKMQAVPIVENFNFPEARDSQLEKGPAKDIQNSPFSELLQQQSAKNSSSEQKESRELQSFLADLKEQLKESSKEEDQAAAEKAAELLAGLENGKLELAELEEFIELASEINLSPDQNLALLRDILSQKVLSEAQKLDSKEIEFKEELLTEAETEKLNDSEIAAEEFSKKEQKLLEIKAEVVRERELNQAEEIQLEKELFKLFGDLKKLDSAEISENEPNSADLLLEDFDLLDQKILTELLDSESLELIDLERDKAINEPLLDLENKAHSELNLDLEDSKAEAERESSQANLESEKAEIFSQLQKTKQKMSAFAELEDLEIDDLKESNFLNQLADHDSSQASSKLNWQQLEISAESEVYQNADVETQIIEGFKAQYSAETKEMSIQLEPESLGKIELKLSHQNDNLRAEILVENESIKANLEESLNSLKNDLIREGINIEEFKIEHSHSAPREIENQAGFSLSSQQHNNGQSSQNQQQNWQHFKGIYYPEQRAGAEPSYSDLKESSNQLRRIYGSSTLNLLA